MSVFEDLPVTTEQLLFVWIATVSSYYYHYNNNNEVVVVLVLV